MSRPLKFESVEDLSERISEYFYACDTHMKTVFTKDGEAIEVPVPKPYTISGLAYFLGTSRKVLLEYESRNEEFSNTIKNAKAKIEAYVEESLWTPKVTAGVIFNLKNNFGWVDKTDINHGGGTENTLQVVFDSGLDDE